MKSIRVFITENCNARCQNCINAKARNNSEMDILRFSLMCKYFKENGIKNIRIMGGEPTIHPDFTKLMKIAQNTFERVTLFTNAITNGISKFVPRELDGINYNFNFSSGLTKQKLLLNLPGSRILEVVLTPDSNPEKIIANISRIADWEPSRIIVSLTLDCTSNIFKERDQIIPIYETIWNACNEKNIKVVQDHAVPICFLYGSKIPIRLKGAFCTPECAGLIDADFNICYCNQHPMAIRNLFTNTNELIPFKIINNYIEREYYKNQLLALEKICSNCVFFNKYCNGGCFITRTNITKNDIILNTKLPLS